MYVVVSCAPRFPANAVGDDIEVYGTEESKDGSNVQAVFHTLRQQAETETDGANLALSDFVAPKNSGIQCVL